MHLLVRETHSLEESESVVDLGQTPADLILLSFSDSDLGAAAAAWASHRAELPSLRLANLSRLLHPMSVDLYLDRVAAKARCILVRLLGGLDYWRYGVEELAALAREKGIALALLPGEGADDPRLGPLSTIEEAKRRRLGALFAAGGPANLARALDLMAHLANLAQDPGGEAEILPQAGRYEFGSPHAEGSARAAIVFYRSHLLAGDLAPLEALARSLEERGLEVHGLYASSLKDPAAAAFIARNLALLKPSVVLNATGFAARGETDAPSPLEAAGVPLLQLVLSGSSREAWEASSRGLGQADLAMQVALPELDGRILAGAISFKAEALTVPELEFSRRAHAPYLPGIAAAARSAAGWARLGRTPRFERRLALVLSDYPGAGSSRESGEIAHAVGLDALASTAEILKLLGQEGYDTGAAAPTAGDLTQALCHGEAKPFLALAEYRRLFAALPEPARKKILAAWGEAEADPACRDGFFHLRHLAHGKILIAVQPDRGRRAARKSTYHDPDLPPCHAYVAFYLWLRRQAGIEAMIHLGTHGTLEWLPGKAVALSETCYPALLAGGLPVIYPFIVNNPGEAAAAKRRLGAVTIGHLTPPLARAGASGEALELEKRIDEYAAADGLDRRRADLLRGEILSRAEACGLLVESGVAPGAEPAEALARLDAYLCDVKDLQIRDGLHVFGRTPQGERRRKLLDALRHSCAGADADDLAARLEDCGRAERTALLSALDARFVPPGPAGAPSRGRADVLPTGRNLFTLDPRAVPTRSAVVLAEKAADELLRRHLQEQGDWPRALVIDLWGSATMRTGGEDLALALLLMGARPQWDEGSNRVAGIEILPLALLDRPRIDVTLRISGLFRDAFAPQIALFDAAVRAIAARDEPDKDWNPLAAAAKCLKGDAFRRATTRIYGAAPGLYGAGVSDLLARGDWDARAELGRDYLEASASAYGQGLDGVADQAGFAERVRSADAFLHGQDHREIDLLDSSDFAAHAGGFAALAASLGSSPALYHADTSDPKAPRMRALAEEVARIVRGRAAHPDWIEGMMAHGYRGGAEIARGIEALFAFAAMLPTRFDAQFDLLFGATLGDEAVDRFLLAANPHARAAMERRFAEAMQRGLWHPRRNAAAERLKCDRRPDEARP